MLGQRTAERTTDRITRIIGLEVPAWLPPVGPAVNHAYDVAVAEQIAQGALTYSAISRDLGISVYLVKKAAQRQNLRSTAGRGIIDPLRHPKVNLDKIRELRKAGITLADVAGQLKRTLARLRTATGEDMRWRLPIEESEMDMVRVSKLLRAGMTYTKIASELDIPRHRLRLILRRITANTGETFKRLMVWQLHSAKQL